jgi:type II secretion system protein G
MISGVMTSLARKRSELDEKEKGFTLIELLVVVIIIGILAAIAIPVYLGIQNNAKDSAVKSDVGNAKIAVVAYQTSNNGQLPTSLSALTAYGYTAPTAGTGNYSGSGSVPALTTDGTNTAFCIYAVAVTGTKVGASDQSGVVSSGTTACSATGGLTP